MSTEHLVRKQQNRTEQGEKEFVYLCVCVGISKARQTCPLTNILEASSVETDFSQKSQVI